MYFHTLFFVLECSLPHPICVFAHATFRMSGLIRDKRIALVFRGFLRLIRCLIFGARRPGAPSTVP